jgi:surface antigen
MNAKRVAASLMIVPLMLLFSGCEGPTKQQSGAVIGAGLGGLLGSRFGHGGGRTAAIIGGSMLGGLLGGAIGSSMDETDQLRAAHALEYNRTSQPSSWTNPDSGAEYTVTPTRTYRAASEDCREYSTEVFIDGQRDVVYGTACRRSDGTWRINS